jgi:hypothetical protein
MGEEKLLRKSNVFVVSESTEEIGMKIREVE